MACCNTCIGGVDTSTTNPGEVVGVGSSTNIRVDSGPAMLIVPPPSLATEGNVRVTCQTLCGPECYCPPAYCCESTNGGRALVVKMHSPSQVVCFPGGWLKSNITQGRVSTSCGEPCAGPCA